MVVLKLLYGVTETRTYWQAIYFKHHQEKLGIMTLIYNPCLLVITTKERFAVVGI